MSSGVRASRVLSIFRGSTASRQVARGVDQPDVGERLRKVAKHPVRFGIVLFRKESDIIAQAEKPFEQLPRLVVSPLQCEIVGKPERAQKE